MTDLSVTLGRLALRNPVLVACGTFGYAKEMAPFVDFAKLGGVIPKTVTHAPRAGNKPPRTVETASGMLNAIGLDNDGLEHFLTHHLPYLRTLPTAIIGNIAGKSEDEFVAMAARVHQSKVGLAALELNLSCPNVSGGTDFASDPELTKRIVRRCRDACPDLPLIAKLTPNVTDIILIAKAAADGGADAVSAVNTFVGMAVDWRRRKPILGNVTGGLSGPAIKPLALRAVWRIAPDEGAPGDRGRRHRHAGRRDGLPGGGRDRGADRHRKLLRPDRERAHRGRPPGGPVGAGGDPRERGGGHAAGVGVLP